MNWRFLIIGIGTIVYSVGVSIRYNDLTSSQIFANIVIALVPSVVLTIILELFYKLTRKEYGLEGLSKTFLTMWLITMGILLVGQVVAR